MGLEILQKHHQQFFVEIQREGTHIHLVNDLHYSNNHYWRQNQVCLDSCLIHKSGRHGIHHVNHSLLHFLHKDLHLYKNLHLQEQVCNNNLCNLQSQVKHGNCLSHMLDHFGTLHSSHNLLHFLRKSNNNRIQFLH